jgi:hypothetical protein
MKKTNKLLTGLIGSAMIMSTLSGCAGDSREKVNPLIAPPDNSGCKNWTYDEETGVYKCPRADIVSVGGNNTTIINDDHDMGGFIFFYAGGFYSNRTALNNNSTYSTYRSSPSYSKSAHPSHITPSTGGRSSVKAPGTSARSGSFGSSSSSGS